MNTIKNFFIFIGILMSVVIGINIIFRIGTFLDKQTLVLNVETSEAALTIGCIVGVVLAIYHFCEDDE